MLALNLESHFVKSVISNCNIKTVHTSVCGYKEQKSEQLVVFIVFWPIGVLEKGHTSPGICNVILSFCP